MKNSGEYVSKKDSADFIRIIKPGHGGSQLFSVTDYYTDGKGKMEATSSWAIPIKLQGLCKTYYHNGNLKEVAFYNNGNRMDNTSNYSPTGKPAFVKWYSDPDSVDAYKKPVRQIIKIITCYDIDGKSLVTNGNGHFVSYDDAAKKVILEGNVKNGNLTGQWNGYDSVMNVNFTENTTMGN